MIAACAQELAGAPERRTPRGFQRILIVRLGSMGDIVHSLPAVATLRRALPGAQIDWVVESRWAELLCSRPELRCGPRRREKPLVDTVHVVDTRAWRKSIGAAATRHDASAALAALRTAQYDAAIDLQGALKSALLMRLSGARMRFGFSRPIESPASLAYTRRIAARGRHIVEQNIFLAVGAIAAAGIAAEPVYEFPLPADAALQQRALDNLTRQGIRPAEFVLMNAGAGWGAKCWPADRFAAVARALASDGLQTVVNHGPGEESLAREVTERSGGAAVAIACSVGELVAIARLARLFIGGDTGPAHLAAALAVPVVGIYGPTDPARNGPYGASAAVLRSPGSVTSHQRRTAPEAGLLEIMPEAVVAAARQLLAEKPARG